MREAYREIIEELLKKPNPSLSDLARAKLRVSAKYRLKRIPTNAELLKLLKPEEEGRLLPLLRRKPTRTLSGVVVIAVMTRPWPCPKEEPCIYCPGGPSMGTPQSYTGHEPAALRGAQNDFDPYRQVMSRISQLKAIGHTVDKVQLIVMGGTFPASPPDYQEFFVKRCLDALNGVDSGSLEGAKLLAEKAPIRNVGITIETRPDWAKEKQVDEMLKLGATQVEIGVQNIYDDIYELVNRGHSVQDVVEATRILKDSGLKVCYHMMPGLPGSNPERDLEAFRRLFSDRDFRPDALKIYPTLVLEGTKLHEMWLRGEYTPYRTEEAVKLLAEVKAFVPVWVRIQRVQRDIPAKLIVDGVKAGNLRELVWREMGRRGLRCRCIRCREVGHMQARYGVEPNPEDIDLVVRRYEASQGVEVFLSYEDTKQDILIGFLRLRIPSEQAHRPEIAGKNAALVRELHIYGEMVPVSSTSPRAWQHRGYGSLLLREAERIAREDYDARKILVMSGLGVKPYYYRHGYAKDGPYVSKSLT
ncbi:tRNA uridine(34) 5-carboxymethylaminomethyl modification radical SAM/GNAT enzyme Elp3 [Candidatus Bathyarchaeota archaeon]|nr:MAG: tRNA uridine(34) 5-carboxymethylaminomethyl modification radical SAM/GNAT enzyme Elp3 [Candidatus Bathyarchaeota archaeon]